MYLTYTQYVANGGTKSNEDFTKAYKPAMYKFNRWTHQKLTQYEDEGNGPSFIAYDMTILINNIDDINSGDQLTSYSNGVETYGISSDSKSAESKVYEMFCDATPLEYRQANIYVTAGGCCGFCRF